MPLSAIGCAPRRAELPALTSTPPAVLGLIPCRCSPEALNGGRYAELYGIQATAYAT